MSDKKIKIKLIKSPIGYNPKIRSTVKALGLRRMNQIREQVASPQVMGMINKVDFLVQIVEEK